MAGGRRAARNARKRYDDRDIAAALESEPTSSTQRIFFAAVQRPALPYSTHDSRRCASMTDVNEIVPELALLSNLSSVPRLKRRVSNNDIASFPEAHIVSLIEASMTVQAILEESPMREEQTLRFLARLITSGLVTWADVGAHTG